MTVPNQNVIYIHKDNLQKDPFLSLNIETLQAVYKDLKNAYTFYLYICLCCNKDRYKLEFSPQHIETEFGMPKSTARDQFKKLVEKKYIVQYKENSNIYNFYAEPTHITKAKKEISEQANSLMSTTFDFG